MKLLTHNKPRSISWLNLLIYLVLDWSVDILIIRHIALQCFMVLLLKYPLPKNQKPIVYKNFVNCDIWLFTILWIITAIFKMLY